MPNDEEEHEVSDLELTGLQTAIDEIAELVEDIGFEPVQVELETGMQPRIYCDAVWDAILQTNNHHHPTLFQKSGAMVRILKTGIGIRMIQPIDYQILHNAITYRVNFVRRLNHKEITKWVDEHPMAQPNPLTAAEAVRINLKPPREIVSVVLNRHEYEGLPELVGIATVPIMDLLTGDINFQSHYDPVAQMYYGRTDVGIPTIPYNPTPEEVQHSVELLKETIIDFPFIKEVDRVNALACIITAVIRPSIPGNIPIYILDKPAPGTGAGLFCDTLSLIVNGELASNMTITKGDDTEWKKCIVSVLREGNLLAFIDNIEDKIDLPSLAALVTSGKYSDRILATNIMFKSPHKNVWILNGNNVIIGGDLGRRVYMSRMDANLSKPWLRAGFHHDQKVWITEQRSNILAAIYTIVRGWVRAGSTPANEQIPIMGSFEEWRNIIGGIMQYIGYNNFLSNSNEVLENIDTDSPAWDVFINTLFERIHSWKRRGLPYNSSQTPVEYFIVEFTSHDILQILESEKDSYNVASDKTPLVELLPDDIADAYANGKNINRVLGNQLRSQMGRIFSNGLKLERTNTTTNNKTHWNITKIVS